MLRLKWLLFGVIGLLAAVGAFWIWQSALGARPGAMGKKLSDALSEGLQASPAVYYDTRVVVEEKRPIAELALVSRAVAVDHSLDKQLLYSKARLSLRAEYRVKAGFDLADKPFAAHLDSDLRRARLDLPLPRVLSLEMKDYKVVEDRSGWWNRISAQDREMALRQMQAQAKLQAIRAGILEECRRELEGHLAKVSEKAGLAVEARYPGGGKEALPLPAEERPGTLPPR